MLALSRATAATTIVLALVVSLAVPASAAVLRSPADPFYRVHLRSGPLGHAWSGVERINFTNNRGTAMTKVWLRLWSNGVLGCTPRAITATVVAGGSAGALREECTAFPVTLSSPLAPGARGQLKLSLSIQLPKVNDRFGYYNDEALLGTALPTLAIRDDAGWHLDPFINLGESFYSVTGRYRVTLNVPTGLRTPSTGVRVEHVVTGGRTTDTFAAEDVRDFEWAAGAFVKLSDMSGATRVNVWYLTNLISVTKARSLLAAAVRALDTFSATFGTYPYSEVDAVIMGFTGFGGMEYPQLVFSYPRRVILVHELAHQWWYGIVGNDEFSDSWLDEPFAQWSQDLPTKPVTVCPSYSWPSSTFRLTNDMTYFQHHQSEYGSVYYGGACMLANLAGKFGLARFKEILHDYAQDHWLGFTRELDFKTAIETAAATDLPGFDADAFWAKWRVD
jgi:hypothetical protein